jgi:hypothetical protein
LGDKAMKKTIIYILFLAVLCSCDDWLDITPKGKVILTTADEYGELFDNTSLIQYTISDISYLDDETWINTQVLVNGWNLMNLITANVLYNEEFDRSRYASGNGGTLGSTFYQSMYERISKVANTIIYNADEGEIDGTTEEISQLVAQAKAYRAFSYFMLVNFYAKPYNEATAASDGAVPLRLDAFVENTPNPAKSTVAEIYTQIQKDIDEAIPDLPESAQTVYRFNKAAGWALKAKVHLFKHEYDECIEAALESYNLNHQTYDLVTRIDRTNHIPNPSIYATGEENLFFATNSTTYFLLHPDLIALFRKGLTDYGESDSVYDMRLYLYQQPNKAIKDYQYTLQYMPQQLQYANNSIGLRTTEVMLMLAECYARKGDMAKVKEYLDPYFTSRYEYYDSNALTIPSDVKSAVKLVLNERRKELTMGCNRYFDLKRLNSEDDYYTEPSRTIPLDTTVTPGIPQGTYVMRRNSSLYVLPFPTKVLENDTRLTSNSMNE